MRSSLARSVTLASKRAWQGEPQQTGLGTDQPSAYLRIQRSSYALSDGLDNLGSRMLY